MAFAAAICADHAQAADRFEVRVRHLLDAELDERIRELAGRSPTRIERKPGATGTVRDREAPVRRRGIGKDAAEHQPVPASGVRWPRGGPRPAPLEVPLALRYLVAWAMARRRAAVRPGLVAELRELLGLLAIAEVPPRHAMTSHVVVEQEMAPSWGETTSSRRSAPRSCDPAHSPGGPGDPLLDPCLRDLGWSVVAHPARRRT